MVPASTATGSLSSVFSARRRMSLRRRRQSPSFSPSLLLCLLSFSPSFLLSFSAFPPSLPPQSSPFLVEQAELLLLNWMLWICGIYPPSSLADDAKAAVDEAARNPTTLRSVSSFGGSAVPSGLSGPTRSSGAGEEDLSMEELTEISIDDMKKEAESPASGSTSHHRNRSPRPTPSIDASPPSHMNFSPPGSPSPPPPQGGESEGAPSPHYIGPGGAAGGGEGQRSKARTFFQGSSHLQNRDLASLISAEPAASASTPRRGLRRTMSNREDDVNSPEDEKNRSPSPRSGLKTPGRNLRFNRPIAVMDQNQPKWISSLPPAQVSPRAETERKATGTDPAGGRASWVEGEERRDKDADESKKDSQPQKSDLARMVEFKKKAEQGLQLQKVSRFSKSAMIFRFESTPAGGKKGCLASSSSPCLSPHFLFRSTVLVEEEAVTQNVGDFHQGG